jgi:hypothetical protein
MRIVLYFINWNDSFYLPLINEHYGKFCERIVMFDNYSSDDSVIKARSLGFEVHSFGMRGQLNDQHYLDVKNKCWKDSRDKGIDYVIVCDADEFVEPDFKFLMTDYPSAPSVKGFNMISDNIPKNSFREINTGAPSVDYSKQAIFSPDRITEINYVHGCHRNSITGNVSNGGNTSLYHLRMIGGIERMIIRHSEYRKRMSKFNKQHKMGFHYEHSDDAKRAEWDYLKSKAIQLW